MNKADLSTFLDNLKAEMEELISKHATWELHVTCVNGHASYTVKSYSQTYTLDEASIAFVASPVIPCDLSN